MRLIQLSAQIEHVELSAPSSLNQTSARLSLHLSQILNSLMGQGLPDHRQTQLNPQRQPF